MNLESIVLDWSALISTAVGAIAAIVGGVVAAEVEKKHAREARRATVVGGVKAIGAELSVNFTRYEERLAPSLRALRRGDIFNFTWPVQAEYFPVYAANASLLGELGNDQLAREIITAVAHAKGMVDSLRLNTDLVQKYELVVKSAESATEDGATEILQQRARLEEYAVALKGLDQLLTDTVTGLLPKIDALHKG